MKYSHERVIGRGSRGKLRQDKTQFVSRKLRREFFSSSNFFEELPSILVTYHLFNEIGISCWARLSHGGDSTSVEWPREGERRKLGLEQ